VFERLRMPALGGATQRAQLGAARPRRVAGSVVLWPVATNAGRSCFARLGALRILNAGFRAREHQLRRAARLLLCMEGGTPQRDTAWAMSEENVEVVCDLFAATNERDFPRAMSHYA
jgi:hypothetical protein